jgi:acyl transferase domain-containing protein/NADPH:quinone reductase-like Zn-dependent oxidoreductase/acyl carrier protein
MDHAVKKNNNPIAIVGLSFRFPGDLCDSEAFWQCLLNKESKISELDNSRWPQSKYYHPNKDVAGCSYVKKAGLLSEPFAFAAPFFKIPPREAEQMDPQQRMLLELSWHAIEDSGILPATLSQNKTGVYIGVGAPDYGVSSFITDVGAVDSHTMLGNTNSIVSNRLSYCYDLKGPSMSIDTACSSSLVALHQACMSLWSGESDHALVGGCNLICHPFPFVGFSKSMMLSEKGQCRSFDQDGDGYVRSEGAAILLLKPLKAAIKDGNNIHAVIVNTGVNSDGKTSSLPVPSSLAQARLLESLYRESNLNPNELAYFEAHGTGTQIGDPIEASAIARALGQKRETPLLIGSVKPNLGHLECGAGMVGLVKLIHCLKNKKVPANNHFDTPNPKIDFNELNLQVVNKTHDLSEHKEPLLMGVNAFGFGGTNAHAILKEYIPPPKKEAKKTRKLPPLRISANSEAEFNLLIKDYKNMIEQQQESYYDIAYSSFFHRPLLSKALLIWPKSETDLLAQLEAYSSDSLISSRSTKEKRKLALVFSGNGCQWAEMGRSLIKSEFKKARSYLNSIEQIFKSEFNLSVKKILLTGEPDRYQLTELAQPALFTLQVIICKLIQDYGVKFDFVVGHSVGEVAAAWASGALSLNDAVKVIYYRSMFQGTTKGSGNMAAVQLSRSELIKLFAELKLTTLEIAAENSHSSSTISGEQDSLKILENYCREKDIFYKQLSINYAFHSKAMHKIKAPLIEALENITAREGKCPFISTVTGEEVSGLSLTGHYWWENIRKPVLFKNAVERLLKDQTVLFIEVGARPILQSYLNEACRASNNLNALKTLEEGKDEETSLLASLSALHLQAEALDLKKWFKRRRAYFKLPSYPFVRQNYSITPTEKALAVFRGSESPPLLGQRLKGASCSWELSLSKFSEPYLADHMVDGLTVFPGTAYLEQLLSLYYQEGGLGAVLIKNLEIINPLILSDEQLFDVNILEKDGEVTISSKVGESPATWQLHAKGSFRELLTVMKEEINLANLMNEKALLVSREEHYQLCEFLGLSYRGDFKLVDKLWCSDKQILAKLRTETICKAALISHKLYPPILDAALQSAMGFYKEQALWQFKDMLLVPVKFSTISFSSHTDVVAYSVCRLEKISPRSLSISIKLLTEEGRVLVDARGVRLQAIIRKTHAEDPRLYREELAVKRSLLNEERFFGLSKLEAALKAPLKEHFSFVNKQAGRLSESLNALRFFIAVGIYKVLSETLQKKEYAHLSDIEEELKVQKTQRAYFQFCFSLLRDFCLVEYCSNNEVIRLLGPREPLSFELLWLTLFAEHALNMPELLTIPKLCQSLIVIWQGKKTVEQIINRKSEYCSKEALFQSSLHARSLNECFDRVFYSLLKDFPSYRAQRALYFVSDEGGLPNDLMNLDSNLELVICALSEECFQALKQQCQSKPLFEVIKYDGNEFVSRVQGRFNFAVFKRALSAFDDLVGLLKSLRTILESDACLLLAEHDNNIFSNFYYGGSESWWQSNEADYSGRLISASSLRKLLADSGFLSSDELYHDLGNHAYILAAQPLAMLTKEMAPKSETETVLFSNSQQEELLTLLKSTHKRALHYPYNLQAIDDWCTTLDTTEALSDHQVILHFSSHSEQFESEQFLSGVYQLITALKRLSSINTEKKHSVTILFELMAQLDENNISALMTYYSVRSMLRVFQNEAPQLPLSLVKIESALNTLCPKLFFEAIETDGFECVLNDQNLSVNQVIEEPLDPNLSKGAAFNAVRLDFKQMGSLDNLYWQPFSQRKPTNNELLIKPMAVGLNFRDVMYTIGFISDEAVENGFLGASLGMEFSGLVVACGADCQRFRVGDKVFGFSSSSFSSSLILSEEKVHALPNKWSHFEAATVPVAFFTAYYALTQQAQLTEGENVLIHGAAGGVGIAAIQVASLLGAEVIATAGCDDKRLFVQMLGSEKVYNSRDLNFVEKVELEIGKVDVVLNCLSGQAMEESLSLLAPFGRFVELGKRDFYLNSKIGLNPFKNNISYFGVDVDQLIQQKPNRAIKLFEKLMAEFEQEALRPLPLTTFKSKEIKEGFRYMQQAKQIGKVVIDLSDLEYLVQDESGTCDPVLSKEHYYLITGGSKGLGLETARTFINNGARKLLLLSKTGLVSEPLKELLAMYSGQVEITLLKADVSEFAELERALSPYINQLAGLVHAANHYHDALISSLKPEPFEEAMRAKVLGAWNLHRLTKTLTLDFFVMYSSVSNLIGNVGQVSYVSANGALEGLVEARRAMGLCGKVMSFGPVSDVGILSRKKELSHLLTEKGMAVLPAELYLNQFFKLLQRKNVNDCLAHIDFSVLYQSLPSIDRELYRHFKPHFNALSAGSNQEILAKLQSLEGEEKHSFLSELLSEEIINILKLPVSKVSPDESFADLGLDSIMGVELMHVLEKKLSVKIPVMILSQGNNINELSKKIIEHLNMSNKQHYEEQFDTLSSLHNIDLNDEARSKIIQDVAEEVHQL